MTFLRRPRAVHLRHTSTSAQMRRYRALTGLQQLGWMQLVHRHSCGLPTRVMLVLRLLLPEMLFSAGASGTGIVSATESGGESMTGGATGMPLVMLTGGRASAACRRLRVPAALCSMTGAANGPRRQTCSQAPQGKIGTPSCVAASLCVVGCCLLQQGASGGRVEEAAGAVTADAHRQAWSGGNLVLSCCALVALFLGEALAAAQCAHAGSTATHTAGCCAL